jgi:hypothetical protein
MNQHTSREEKIKKQKTKKNKVSSLCNRKKEVVPSAKSVERAKKKAYTIHSRIGK